MKTILAVTAAVVTLSCATATNAMSDTECASAWKAADANSDGVLSEAEGTQYYAKLRSLNKPVTDGKLDQALYMEQCKTGAFDVAKLDEGTPLKGANSFTAAQATDRIIQAGLKDVSKLEKDSDGIWRGTANDGSKSVSVAVDFRGNVVVK